MMIVMIVMIVMLPSSFQQQHDHYFYYNYYYYNTKVYELIKDGEFFDPNGEDKVTYDEMCNKTQIYNKAIVLTH